MSRKLAISLVLLLSILLIILTSIASASADPPLTVSFIDVGQGDSALIRGDDGFDILIDGGRKGAGETLVAHLRQLGVDDIDVMVASHADVDHMGGLIAVLEMDDIPVQQVLYNGYQGESTAWFQFETAVAEEGLPLTAAQYPQTYTWGQSDAYILNPVPGLGNPAQNDASIVILLDFNDIEFLFTGDIPYAIEETVVARGTPVASEILKVPHHGSDGSTGFAFFSAVQPEEAIVSVGKNSYGHPDDYVLRMILMNGASLWRTDQHGTIIITTDGYIYKVDTTKPNFHLPILLRLTEQTPTLTPAITATLTPTQGVSDTGDIVITTIFYDGAGSAEPDEYVKIYNDDNNPIQLQGWTLRDESDHIFTFPNHIMQPGDICRIYTNEDHPEHCGFNYGRVSAIWTNTGDCAYLRDSYDTEIDTYC